MSFALPIRLLTSRNVQMLCAAGGLMATAVFISSFHRQPRPWGMNEVPIAFWSWRNQTPLQEDLRAAIEKTKARSIFLRAGQIDFQDGKLRRIRPVAGKFPREIDLHLVYNATASLLGQLGNVDEKAFAETINAAFKEDAERAGSDDACVVGLQTDIDVPTRLLGRYERMLKVLRARLQTGVQLSITGLPTWMQSNELLSTLAQVDFWIPQFYGAEIPRRLEASIPISSPSDVERFVNQARALNRPFYAGLAAYSCVLLYDSSGALIELRGDMDPAAIAIDPNLQLINQRPFDQGNSRGSEWRYAYRVQADGVTQGLVVHAGDLLVVDVPTTESLRVSARTVRQLAGEKLLGICVFRLPAEDDPATLNPEQVATALLDRDSSSNIKIRFTRNDAKDRTWLLEIENDGTASLVGGIKIDLDVDAGTIESVKPGPGESVAPMCHVLAEDHTPVYASCSERRANVIRLTAAGLGARQVLKTKVVLTAPPSRGLYYSIETTSDAGERYAGRAEVVIQVE